MKQARIQINKVIKGNSKKSNGLVGKHYFPVSIKVD